MIFRVKLCEFTGDFMDIPGDVIHSVDFQDYMEAVLQHEAWGNSILYKVHDGAEIQLDVLSRGFKPDRVKQFYLNKACDFLGLRHIRLDELNLPDLAHHALNWNIDRILQERTGIHEDRVEKPIINEFIYWILRRKHENKIK